MQKVTVRVPGSTSNLGPGFDCLGIALRIRNSVHSNPRHVSSLSSANCLGDGRPILQAGRASRVPFSYSIAEQVPRCRGLGGSATVRLGILLALNRLSGDRLHRLAVFQVCAELEGHPDNAAPASFGGFTVVQRNANISVTQNHGSRVAAQRTCRSTLQGLVAVYFVLLIPDIEIQTKRARQIWPSKISWIAAVENCANACVATAAFASQHYEKLRGAFADHLASAIPLNSDSLSSACDRGG